MRIFLIYLNSFFLSFFLFLFLFYHNTSIFKNAYFFFSGYKILLFILFTPKEFVNFSPESFFFFFFVQSWG